MSERTSAFRLTPEIGDAGRQELLGRVRRSSAAWRNEALDEYIRLYRELEGVVDRRDDIDRRTAEESLDAALQALAPLSLSSCGSVRTWLWEQVRVTVTGTRPDEAWQALHDASEAMLMLYDEQALRRQAPRLETQLAHLDDGDGRLLDYKKLIDGLRDTSTPTDADTRARLRDLSQATHQASDRYQRDVRALRNNLYIASLAVLLALLAAGIVHALNPQIFSLCAAKATALGNDLCANGGVHSGGYEVVGAASMGILGGLLSAIVPFVRGDRISSRYRVFMAQMALKVTAGALSGVLGVLLLQSGLLVGLAPQQGSKIYAYAAFFGFAQQLLTGFIDRYAGDLAKRNPAPVSKRPAATQPAASQPEPASA